MRVKTVVPSEIWARYSGVSRTGASYRVTAIQATSQNTVSRARARGRLRARTARLHEKRNPSSTRVFAACSFHRVCRRCRDVPALVREGTHIRLRTYLRAAPGAHVVHAFSFAARHGTRRTRFVKNTRLRRTVLHFEFNRDRVRKRSRSRMTEKERRGRRGGSNVVIIRDFRHYTVPLCGVTKKM